MSYFLDRLQFFRRTAEPFANGHGEARTENRDWEDSTARAGSTTKLCAQRTV